jgi:hypothetical protein
MRNIDSAICCERGSTPGEVLSVPDAGYEVARILHQSC